MARPSTKDREWLANNQSQLLLLERAKTFIIKGNLCINHSYEGAVRDDAYTIRVELADDATTLPKVYEKSGRLQKVLDSHPEFLDNKAELHMYPSGRICLAAPQELRLDYLPNPSLELLVGGYIVPFFYTQSYFEEFRKWPWKHLRHGASGLVEWYLENTHRKDAIAQTIKALEESVSDNLDRSVANGYIERGKRRESFNPRNKCLCGSGKTYQMCPGHMPLTKLALAIRYS